MLRGLVKRVKQQKEEGQLFADIGSVVGLLVVIAIGALVLYSITGALEVEPGSHAENAIKNVEEKGSTAFNLMTILAIVVVAAVIIGTVIAAIGGVGRRPAPAPAYAIPGL